ncbi:ABC-type Zn uptake system ZnuABC [Fructobacillus cardui]|uniref:Zn-binding component ZnuA (ZnuA) n=1 Tax=Fructobacillus cardui TaxID=2893170 RepID=A0ABN9Z066_9LACO|nr:ABC-type Zn uptake system ZnuABC [Fructobacillus cardui]CAK1252781.1 ABC-type Zn uptake system ZnuABC [Fructobacillus cardui]
MIKRLTIIGLAALALLAGVFYFVNESQTGKTSRSGKLQVVATNSIIGNMVEEVAGNKVKLHTIVPRGTDPHEYEPRPQDVKATQEADVLFHNGLNLENGGSGWFKKMYQNAGKKANEQVFAVSDGVAAKHLTDAGKENEMDPHAWLDIQNGIKYVQNIEKVLIEKDPKNKSTYQKNAAAYIEKLTKLDQSAKTKFNNILADKKLLVTSEGAFKYFSAAYGITPAFIWEINTESQGTPEQMKTVLEKIRATKVPVLFVESSVSPKSMDKVSKETGLPIYAKIYTDSLAKEGKPGDTYYGMMKWNLDKISAGLSK